MGWDVGLNDISRRHTLQPLTKNDILPVLLYISEKTEITETAMPKLSSVQERFILHWGEMGARWGINRTVAQIYALLYISPKPLHAEEIAETLSVARSNVSTSLKELQAWGVVKVVHILGDRRDHFEAMKDVWEMFRTVIEERKKREIDPTLAVLRECVAEADRPDDDYTQERLGELLDLLETMTAWYSQICQMSTPAMINFVKMGDRVLRVISPRSRSKSR